MAPRAAAWACAAGLVLVPAAAAARPPVRGVVEGYYGRPWSGAARRDVIRFLGAHGLNTFVYGPKNDDHHRARWREPYPAAALADLRATVRVARRAGVRFVYAVSPVLDVCYACPADFEALTAKLAQVARTGVRRFALFFDDGGGLTAPEDVARYGGTDAPALARAQGDLTNRVRRWLRSRRLDARPLLVPSDYFGTACRPYHAELARVLAPGIPVAWTGPAVLSTIITEAAVHARAACLPRHPVVLWDNYPVNDTVLSNSLHLGPLSGREPGVPRALRGYLLNPMTQAHASLIALATAADYLKAPGRYDAAAAFERAIGAVGSSGFATLARQMRSSFLDLADARELAAALDALAATYSGADWRPALDALAAEVAAQADAPADIALRLGGTPLADEIAPWTTELGTHAARALDAVRLLGAMKPTLAAAAEPAGPGSLRVHGTAGPPDAAAVAALGPVLTADASAAAARTASPPLAAYVTCLGPFLSADIRFCPGFGLNVHGKALYVAIAEQLLIVADRNVHDRLLAATAAAYQARLAVQGPGADALTVTVEGMPVALAADGGFAATVPVAAGGRARVVVTTGAGAATATLVP